MSWSLRQTGGGSVRTFNTFVERFFVNDDSRSTRKVEVVIYDTNNGNAARLKWINVDIVDAESWCFRRGFGCSKRDQISFKSWVKSWNFIVKTEQTTCWANGPWQRLYTLCFWSAVTNQSKVKNLRYCNVWHQTCDKCQSLK